MRNRTSKREVREREDKGEVYKQIVDKCVPCKYVRVSENTKRVYVSHLDTREGMSSSVLLNETE